MKDLDIHYKLKETGDGNFMVITNIPSKETVSIKLETQPVATAMKVANVFIGMIENANDDGRSDEKHN